MASTITLTNSMNWVAPFVGYLPLNVGASNEPAITSANTILQTILAPPFAWRWNRKSTTTATVQGTQDYSVAIADFGYLETASIALAGGQTFPLEFRKVLTEATEQSRPTFISTQKDDDAGNITFRLLPVPDQVYTLNLTYQVRPTLFTSLTQTWSPIPDFYQFIYSWGFLALMGDYLGLNAAQHWRQLFVASLLGVSEGLDESAKKLFLESWLGQVRQEESIQLATQTGYRARSM